MNINEYLYKSTKGQSRSNNIIHFRESGPGSGMKGHTTPHTDDLEMNKLLNDFENNPRDAKGRGQCQIAVQQIARLLLKKGYTKDDMEVHEVRSTGPDGKNSNHVVLKVAGVFIDPTGKQYDHIHHGNHNTMMKELPPYYEPYKVIPVDQYVNGKEDM